VRHASGKTWKHAFGMTCNVDPSNKLVSHRDLNALVNTLVASLLCRFRAARHLPSLMITRSRLTGLGFALQPLTLPFKEISIAAQS